MSQFLTLGPIHGQLLFLSYIASVESFTPVGRHHMDAQHGSMLPRELESSSVKHASHLGGKVYISSCSQTHRDQRVGVVAPL
ncbi:hypothetical protein IW261DRAFT_1443978 [Armillaria novae-zelandiae]|uniref:Uncharacterized protein n=1 Tax=Armillaria novae-zelandiae TaxID=153914 RepID=A0AA39PRN3_9AGAR|nr:hypothetical protein IW261DRAFT_1443978 [Armillaria novae-zelandiae]